MDPEGIYGGGPALRPVSDIPADSGKLPAARPDWSDYPDLPESLDRRPKRPPTLGPEGDSLDDLK
jgi:hypothetical protein